MIARETATYRDGLFDELVVDNFAGGGGAGLGIELALGRPVDHAINHDSDALAMHRVNHPGTEHHHSDVWEVDPREVARGRPIGLAWFSPDCKHFSKAKGGKPVSPRVRGLAWVVVRWAATVRPRVIMLENVEEFQTWGPLTDDNLPCPRRKGQTFNNWVRELRKLGYAVEWRELRACDYGAPTIRKRLFLIARCDGQPIIWPEQTHGDIRNEEVDGTHAQRERAVLSQDIHPTKPAIQRVDAAAVSNTRRSQKRQGERTKARRRSGGRMQCDSRDGLKPYRTAASCIDWSIPCPSIFDRPSRGKKPLAKNTMRRIAAGIKRYVLDSPRPFLVGVGGRAGQSRPRSVDEPCATVTAKADTALCIPTLVQTGYGERKGQAPRVPGLDKPLGTVVAGGGKHALVAAFMAKHYGGMVGVGVDTPCPTVTTRGTQNQVVAAHLTQLYGSNRGNGGDIQQPLGTTTAGGKHAGLVAALLVKYYGNESGGYPVDEPIHTIPTRDRYGLVQVQLNGEPYVITDIGMRMLQPRELYRAQGFGDDYIIDRGITEAGDEVKLTKTAQVRMCGNSVCPPMAEVLVRANVVEPAYLETQRATP